MYLVQLSMNTFQEPQVDVLLRLNYPYVALTALWLYDYILCIPDALEFIAGSQWGLGTFFYLACSHLPFAFVSLNMLAVFQHDTPFHLCRSYAMANYWTVLMLSAECIFILRGFAAWERVTWLAVFAIVSIIGYLVPIFFYIGKLWSDFGECWIPGTIGYLNANERAKLYIVYGLLVAAELEIFFFLLYRAVKSHGGWKTENRLMRGLLQQNLLYFGCSFALTLGIFLTILFFPFAHLLAEYQVILQAFLVTRMHRDFRRLNLAPGGIHTDMSSITYATRVPDIT
ncbi:uncharacterized protein EDB93DRAFT_804848 [Suillus bovinus]|uniref:uncharacterized protein n=1 Tax=Suillus bovinus TaxID=48563 RepID=UPI001B870069|nr:uncharacterized protein EDB93DRAFT_804848 [Suillus bovinus]KAG2157653.1 hypothetical protein EDB93DRAFT_804848 [Suillus bovinus]